MSSFDHYLEDVLARAAREAQDDGSATVEARHLLLAVTAIDDSLLGLDHHAVRSALDREFTQSLATAGVRVAGDVPRASRPPSGNPGLGASAKAALERAFAAIPRKRDASPAHLAIGILSAEAGTVPRALDLAGVDRKALLDRLRRP
nr:Clp protease N-terminal domain-containing protein [uncultured Actinoplanes sp.]